MVEKPEKVIGTTTVSNRLDYLSLPVLAKGRIDLKSLTPYVLAGIRFDHMLGYESEGDIFNQVFDAFDPTTIGGSVGAGVEIDDGLAHMAAMQYR